MTATPCARPVVSEDSGSERNWYEDMDTDDIIDDLAAQHERDDRPISPPLVDRKDVIDLTEEEEEEEEEDEEEDEEEILEEMIEKLTKRAEAFQITIQDVNRQRRQLRELMDQGLIRKIWSTDEKKRIQYVIDDLATRSSLLSDLVESYDQVIMKLYDRLEAI